MQVNVSGFKNHENIYFTFMILKLRFRNSSAGLLDLRKFRIK
jgi:hypothetical protein